MDEATSSGLCPWHTDDVDIKELERLGAAYHAANEEAKARRKELFEAIREASVGADKLKQVEIVNATGITREHVRRINRGEVKLRE